MNILDEIFTVKREEVRVNCSSHPLEVVRREAEAALPAFSLTSAVKRSSLHDPVRLIAEVKCASPSRGQLSPNFNPLELASVYKQNGAAAISILTDQRFFKGSLTYLQEIAALHLGLPLLRKDFIFDPYQVYEARAAGADAILLIASYLDVRVLADLYTLTVELGMEALIEVHNKEELEKTLILSPTLVGVNNRDLKNFQVHFETCLDLRTSIPAGVTVVAESGIHSAQDVDRLAAAGIDAMLVGEALVTAPDPGVKIKELLAC